MHIRAFVNRTIAMAIRRVKNVASARRRLDFQRIQGWVVKALHRAVHPSPCAPSFCSGRTMEADVFIHAQVYSKKFYERKSQNINNVRYGFYLCMSVRLGTKIFFREGRSGILKTFIASSPVLLRGGAYRQVVKCSILYFTNHCSYVVI